MSVQSSDKRVGVTYVVIAVLSYIVKVLLKPQLVSASSSERIISHYAFLQHVYTMARQLVLQVQNFCTIYLLRIHSSLQLRHIVSLAYCPQENGLELVHTSIRKEESRIIVGYHRGRRDYILRILVYSSQFCDRKKENSLFCPPPDSQTQLQVRTSLLWF